METTDLDAARKAICARLDEYQNRKLAQMTEDLKWRYPAHPDEMAVTLHGMTAAELRRRTRPGIVLTPAEGGFPTPLQVRDRSLALFGWFWPAYLCHGL